MNWLARHIVTSAENEYGRAKKSFFTLWGFLVFAVLVPAVILVVSKLVDGALGLDLALGPLVQGIAGGLLLACGVFFVLWTMTYQLRHSGGTPAFKAPPRRLLVEGPYRWCRNPMVSGYLASYYALVVLFASPAGLLFIVPLLNALALYETVVVEEVELEVRFGGDYRAYKDSVNRMVPLPPAWRAWLDDRSLQRPTGH